MPGTALPGLWEYCSEQNREVVGGGHIAREKKSKEGVREYWGIQLKIRWSDKCNEMTSYRSEGN